MNSHEKEHAESESFERYTFTLPPSLIEKIDNTALKKEMNRSQIVREALNAWLSEDLRGSNFNQNVPTVSILSYIYDHHDTRVVQDILHSQHEFDEIILSSTHIHLSHTECFEIVVAKGVITKINKLSDSIRSVKGLNNFRIYITQM